MNEQAAREVLLARALETADTAHELFSQEDRRQASRDARQQTQRQDAPAGAPQAADEFLHRRARLLLQQAAQRHPDFAPLAGAADSAHRLWALVPAAAFLAGVLTDQITDPHRVDLLSPPLLLIVVWNLAVYAALLAWAALPSPRAGGPGRPWRRLPGLDRLQRLNGPRRLPAVLVRALAGFGAEWARLGGPLAQARLGRAFHLGAALFALGAVLSLYARGYVTQYVAGWESTFLDAAQVHALLSALFAPAVAVFGLQGFTLAEVEALRFGQAPVLAGGARWVQLYAATLGLLVVLPRLLLASLAHQRVRQGARHVPLDLGQPYFLRLLRTLGGAPGTLRVLPYSLTVDAARAQGLAALAARLLGEQAQLAVQPPVAYGQGPAEALRGLDLNDAAATLTAVLFGLSATPEPENHGALLDHVVRAAARGVAVLIDESAYRARAGVQAGGTARMDERRALWREFCRLHGASATFVNLLDPQADALDSGAGLALSSAP